MDEKDIQNQIKQTVAASPAEQKNIVSKKIEAPEQTVQTTHVTGDIEGNDAEQVITEPGRGVEFSEDATDVYSGGIAIPKSKYNTRRQQMDSAGNPLYFEPNYQEVVPFNVDTPYGQISSTTLDPEKLAWQIATSIAGTNDDKFIGYKEMPYAGSLGWGSLALGGLKRAVHDFPEEIIKGGAALTIGRYAAALRNMANIPDAIDDKSGVADTIKFGAEQLQAIQDTIDRSMNWAEQEYGTKLDADLQDQSLKAQTARGVSAGLVNFGAALLLKKPEMVFGLLNFAGQNEMRKNALNAGASPWWADAYSIGGAALNSVLDMFQFEAVTGGFALTRKSVYEQMAKEGIYKFHLGRALARNAVDLAIIEPGTEMIQESIEGAYDEDFIKDPTDRLAVAAISAMALKAVMLPSAVRHARQEERLAVAQALGVDAQYLSLLKDAKTRIDGWIEQGKVNKDQGDELLEMIISRAPDQIVNDMRRGVLGQLDKVSPKERQQFADLLTNVDKKSVTMKAFNELDQRVDNSLQTVDLPASQKQMIKGLIRGVAALKLVQDGTSPTELTLPNFKVEYRTRGSAYDTKTNTVIISSVWSDTEFTKVKGENGSEYNQYIRNGFIPSSSQSDRMSSIIHEMAHWLDKTVGEKGYADFLEHYYNNIAAVFGDQKAMGVYKASKQGAKRMPRESSRNYTSETNATEWNAQAVTRLGKRSAAQFGLSNSQAARFLSYANIMFNQLGEWTKSAGMKRNAEIFANYQTAIQSVTKQNMDVIEDLVNTFGDEGLRRMLRDFLDDTQNYNEDFTEYLAKHDALKKLFDVMDSFADAAGIDKIAPLFKSNEEIQSFVDKGDIYFRNGYDNAVAEIKEKRAAKAEKAAQNAGAVKKPIIAKNTGKQVQLQNGTTATLLPNGGLVGPDGMPNFGGDGGIDAVRALLKPDENTSEENVVEELIGIQANLPITAELNRAQQMMIEQVPAEQIFKETGWFLDNKDNKWKYEIPSGEIDTTGLGQYVQKPNGDKVYREKRGNLSDFYKNEKLYQAYPFLKNVPITLVGVDDGSTSGSTDYKGNDARFTIKYNVNDIKESAEHVLVHEIQHAIQFVEGFARGGTSSEFMNIGRIRNAYNVNGQEAGSKVLKEEIDKAWPKYQALAGEIEARNVQTRRAGSKLLPGLGNPEGVLPTLTQDIPDSQAIIKFDDVEINKFIPQGEVLDEIPNNYTFGTDPVAEIRDAVKQGENPADEVPSYDKEVDGRKLGEDINYLRQGIMARAKNLPNKIVKWAASSPWGWGLDRIVTTMFGREASNQLDIAGKYTRRSALRSGMYAKFMQELAPIIGDVTKDKTAAMFKYKTMLNNLGFVRVKGVEINDPYSADVTTVRDLTGWEVMYVYLMQRMGTKYGNRVQQSTKTDINELIATLSDEEKQFADAMSKTLRDVWVGIVGDDKAVQNYFPILDARHAMLDEVNIDTFKERMETDAPIAIDDAGRIFSKDISRLSSWQSGYYQTLKRLREVLQYKGAEGRNIDPAIDDELMRTSALLAGQISNTFGRDAYHNLLRLLDTQIADPQDQMLDSASSKTLQQMGNNVIKSMLSFKFLSLPKNLANITMMWGGASDQSTYWNGFAEGIADMKRTWEYMMKHSNEIHMRYNDAGYNEFLDQRNTGGSTAPIFKGISKIFAGLDWTGDKTGGMAKMSAALDMMGDAGLKMFMLNGDAVANVYGGYGLIKDYMKQGLSEEQAFRKLDRYIVEHQSSSNLAMKPLGQLQANKSLAGQVMAFTSEGVAKWASILGTFDEIKMGTATKSEAIANAMSIAMSMLLFTALSAGVWDLWDDDEKIQEEAVKSLEGAMIDQLFGGSVLGNGFLTPAVQGFLGLGGNMGISAPLWSFFTEGVSSLKRGEYDRIITKSMEATGALVGANALYNDLLGLMFMNSNDPDVREAGFRMLAGRTPGYAEKRTGAKIKNVEKEDEE